MHRRELGFNVVPHATRLEPDPGTPVVAAAPVLTSGDARLRLLQLADSLAQVQAEAPAEAPGQRGPSGLLSSMLRSGRSGLTKLLRRATASRPSLVEQPGAVKYDEPLDTAWAHAHPSLNGLVQLFHQDWHGIRAAAGYLPGKKIAIAYSGRLTVRDLAKIAERCQGAPAVVFHGWSDNMTLVAHALREAFGPSAQLIAVWHGNTAQFINHFEVLQVQALVQLRRAGVLTRLTSVKPDFHMVADEFDDDLLLNLPPRLRPPPRVRSALESAFIPVPIDWRKNLHTNLFACSAAGLKSVYLTADLGTHFELELKCKVHRLPRPSRHELFALLGAIDVVMNASLSECQPMTALEGLALGVPCLTGPLGLGALDAHPYQQLAQLAAVDIIGAVTQRLRRLDEVARTPGELDGIMADYRRVLTQAALASYERVLS